MSGKQSFCLWFSLDLLYDHGVCVIMVCGTYLVNHLMLNLIIPLCSDSSNLS